jgi:hypothetical protein
MDCNPGLDAERSRRLKVDDELEFGRLQHPSRSASLPPDLTRGSIFFERTPFAKKMDCRVKPKPGNDERRGRRGRKML